MPLPQPSPDTPDILWFSLNDGVLGLGWLTTLILVALLAVGLTALWRVLSSLLQDHRQVDAPIEPPEWPSRR